MKHIISRLPLWPLLAAALFSSCTLDERIWGDDFASQSEKLTIRIAVPGNARPATRALGATDEYAVGEVTVLAFDQDDKQFYGRYPGFVTNGPTGTGGAAADMTFQVSLPVGEFDLMVVVNGNTMLNAAQAAGNLDKGDAQATVTEAIQATMGTSGWDVDATPTLLPMWGYKMGVVITETTTSLADPINLTRMVAKVDIQLDSALIAAGKFKLQSVRVYNYMEQGRLIPDIAGANAAVWDGITFAELKAVTTPTLSATPSKATSASEWIDYTLAPNATALERSIYLFEATAGVSPIANPVNYLLNPCLVIGGSYNNGPTTYYRIDFAKDIDPNPNDAVHNWQYLPLMRNNSYTITVTDITGNGHGSQDDALKSIPVNIEANIIDWVENDLSVEGSNGIYKLKVSQRAYDFDSYARNGSSSDNLLTIVTDYDGGWTATSDAAWLTLSTASEASANDPLGTDVRLLVEAYTGNDERTATVTVAAGNIRLKVKVVQMSGYIFNHEDQTWLSAVNDLGPYNHNYNDFDNVCPAGYSRPTLAVAESMRTQVPLDASRDYWSSQIVAVTPPTTFPTSPAEGSLYKTEASDVSGAWNKSTTTLAKKAGQITTYVWTTIVPSVYFVGVDVNNMGGQWYAPATNMDLVGAGAWRSYLNVYFASEYGDYQKVSEGAAFLAAVNALDPSIPRTNRTFSYIVSHREIKVSWYPPVQTFTASAYVRCVKQLVP